MLRFRNSDLRGPDGSRNFFARSSLLMAEAVNLPEDLMVSYVCEGSLMLKLTKGSGDRVTMLKEETSMPTGSEGGMSTEGSESKGPDDLEVCEELEGLERAEGSGGGFDIMPVREWGTKRMREMIFDWRPRLEADTGGLANGQSVARAEEGGHTWI